MYKEKYKKNRILRSLPVLFLAGIMMIPAYAAPSVDDAKDKKNQLENELENVEEDVAKLKEEVAGTREYLDQLDAKLAELSEQLAGVEKDLETTREELTTTQAELEEAKTTKDKQYEDMKKRIKFMYENGDTAYLEMILGAKDFTDMLNKADYVKAISEYDRNMLIQFQSTVEEIAVKEAQIQQKYSEIETLKTSVEEQKASVEALTAAKTEEMEKYSKEIAESEELKEQYEAEIDAQEALIEKLEAEAIRKAEEAARKKAEEEAKKASQSASAGDSSSGKTDSSSGTSATTSTGWTWPCPSSRRITSEYGWRMHPTLGYKKYHNGIDIGASTGSPILAASSGTVIAASYNSSMGNYVMIDHGGGVITIYMHCSALNTSTGSQVSTGQTIAYVGSTGRSTGPHLHFGVRVNGEYTSPWNYVN